MVRPFWEGFFVGTVAVLLVFIALFGSVCIYSHPPKPQEVVNTHECELASYKMWNQHLREENEFLWAMYKRNLVIGDKR